MYNNNGWNTQMNPRILFDFTHPYHEVDRVPRPKPIRPPINIRRTPGGINWANIKPEHQPSEFGPHYWYMLHNMSLNYQMNPTKFARQKMRAFVEALPYLLPCKNCSEHAKEFMAGADLNKALTNRKTLFTFMWNFHNHVNKRLGKPEMSFNDALQMYKSK